MPTLANEIAIARRHHNAGELAEAENIYREILAADPNNVACLHLLGVVYGQTGRRDAAIGMIERALALMPDYADAHFNLGFILQEQGRPAEAAARYQRALALQPDMAAAHLHLGILLAGQNRPEEAVEHCRQAVALQPGWADAHNNLGALLAIQGKLTEAVACYQQALALKEAYAEAHNNLGIALQDQSKFVEAARCFERALALRPDWAEAHDSLGSALEAQGKADEAVLHYRRALALKPDLTGPYIHLGRLFMTQGMMDEAQAHFGRAVELEPDNPAANLALCMAQLPALYADEADIEKRRAAFAAQLRRLCGNAGHGISVRDLAKAIGTFQPFYLAYQGCNDRDLLGLYGSLICRVMADLYPPASLGPPPGRDEKLRVGIVSGFMRNHASWKSPGKGFLTGLDRRRFQLFGYHTGTQEDAETRLAASLCDRFVQGPLWRDRWRKEILADAPHVLIYPEVGMDPMAAQLAAQRLARVQCVSWGHPDTSGYPTLDHYLSSELMEPPDGQDHYTEQLVLLPNLSLFYEPIAVQPVPLSRAELGMRPTATVYWSGQSLFKYLPQYDQVFPRIARAVGDCQFVFIRFAKGAYVTDVFRARLAKAFAAFGLKAQDHCVFLTPLDQDRFVAAMGLCDIFLDNIGWSGGNTTLESMAHDLPIVTMPGSQMRGRHSAAFLTMMGITDMVAATIDDYVAIAARLARDMPWRLAVRKRIADNKHRLHRDRSCIDGLEAFLDRVVRGAGASLPSR